MTRKKTNPQMHRFQLIDRLICEEDYPSFYFILEELRKLLKDEKFSEPTLRRDLRYMRKSLGAPIVYDSKKDGYYYSAPFNFPLSSLTKEEIFLLGIIQKLIAKYADANPIYKNAARLISSLYPSTQHIPLLDRIVVARSPMPIFNQDTLNTLLHAIATNQVIDFIYRSFWEPNQSHRTVLPCQIVVDNGQVFLYAADEKNHDHIRLYDVHKIYELQVMNRTFTLPKNWQFVEEFEQGRFGPFQYDESYDFKIAFYGRVARKRIHRYIWADDQQLEEFPKEEKTILSFSSSQWIPIQEWLLSFGSDAIPLEPDWFVQGWKESVRKMAENARILP